MLERLKLPFKNLRNLTIGMEARFVSLLASRLNPTSLTALDLRLTDRQLTFNPLSPILSLVNLQQLSIIYDDNMAFGFPSSDILPLKNLKSLRRLDICLPLLPVLTDEQFISMVESRPEVEVLDLACSCNLSTTSLTALGQHFPQLEDCSMIRDYDLNDWQNISKASLSTITEPCAL